MTLLATRPAPAPAPVVRTPPRWGARDLGVCLVFVALCLNSAAGRITPDTKNDLVVDPFRFLGRALQLWDPQGFAGQLQNQAYGYLFPMGPFFGVLHAVGVPGWVAQRLWWAVLLSVAYLGLSRLARALDFGGPLTSRIAGVAYACSPHVLTLLGANSVESLPMCVAPWVVLVLVRGSSGEWSARRAGLACGVAVLCMGGVNAAADLGGVLPGVLWLLTRRPSRPALRLTGWAVGGSLLATLWWVVPLLLLGRYSPPFLDYIENARTTTGTTSLVETLRGTSDWVPYLPSSGWQAGLQLLTEPVLIADSVLVVAAGLVGLTVLRSGHRPWLFACLGLGVVLVTLGHPDPVGAAFSAHSRELLDGVLAPIRNLHKFDVLIRMPLALGLAALLSRVRWGTHETERRRSRMLTRVLAIVVVAGTAAPLLTLNLATSTTFAAVPDYWRQTAAWLGAHAGNGRALLAPASTTPSYVWGTPTDEPLQPLAQSRWEVRNNVPLVSPGHVRVLDELDRMLGTGVTQPDLAAYAARTGIRYLVVRNDLDYRAVGSVAPAVVQATLAASPGLRRVARFGPVVGGTGDYSYAVDQGLQPAQRAVEVWRVAGSGDPRVSVASTVASVSGESLDGPAVLLGSPTGGLAPARTVVTDGLRRREVNYGGASGQHSVTLAAGDDGVLGRKVMDYLPVAGEQHQSTVRYLGARTITASSSAAEPSGFFAVRPDQQPYAAFDGSAETAWQSAPGYAAVGQWVEARLPRPTSVPRVTVRVPRGITAVTVTTDRSSVTSRVSDGVAAVSLDAAISRVRVTVAATARNYTGAAVLDDVTLAGHRIARTVVAPRDVAAGRAIDELSFATPGDERTGCLLADGVPQCVAGRARTSEDGAGLDRTFTQTRANSYDVAMTVQPRPGSALTAVLDRAAGYSVTASASSQAVPDPLASAQTVVDGDGSTGWIAAADDPDPTLTLDLPRRVTVRSLNFFTTPQLAATRPDLVRVTADGASRSAVIGADGVARFAPITTDRLVVHLGALKPQRVNVSSSIAGQTSLGIGVSEIEVPGVEPVTRRASADEPVRVPCGGGPSVVVDGRRLATRIDTTVGAVRDLDRIEATPCGSGSLAVAAGSQRLVAGGTDTFAVRAVRLSRPASATAPAARARVGAWGGTERSVDVGRRTSPQVLVVDENENPGWQATLDGRSLRPTVVDGWRQAWVLPAGAAGTVWLDFAPQRAYSIALLVGLALVLVLLVLFGLAVRRRSGVGSLVTGWQPHPLVIVGGGLAVCGLVGGLPGLIAAAIVALAVTTSRFAAPVVVGGALLVAGAVLALRPFGSLDYAGGTTVVQLLCVVAVAAAVMPYRWRRS